MKKFTKKLLTGVMALGLLAPVTATALDPIQTTVNAKHSHRKSRRSTWHHYAPKAVKGYWLQRHKSHEYWGLTFQNSGVAFNPSGAAIQNWNRPQYKYDGHHTYTIKPSANSHDTADYLGKNSPEQYYVKVRGNHIYVHINGTFGHHTQYIGKYHRVSRRTALGY